MCKVVLRIDTESADHKRDLRVIERREQAPIAVRLTSNRLAAQCEKSRVVVGEPEEVPRAQINAIEDVDQLNALLA